MLRILCVILPLALGVFCLHQAFKPHDPDLRLQMATKMDQVVEASRDGSRAQEKQKLEQEMLTAGMNAITMDKVRVTFALLGLVSFAVAGFWGFRIFL